MAYKRWSKIDPITHRFVAYLSDDERKKKRVRDQRAYCKAWYAKNREAQRERSRDNNRRTKLLCLSHYSGGTPCCACCGETTEEFLSIDHIHGGGHKHRKSIGTGTIWYWLKTNNFPDGFRVLCFNCNLALGHFGYCPHQVQEKRVGGEDAQEQIRN